MGKRDTAGGVRSLYLENKKLKNSLPNICCCLIVQSWVTWPFLAASTWEENKFSAFPALLRQVGREIGNERERVLVQPINWWAHLQNSSSTCKFCVREASSLGLKETCSQIFPVGYLACSSSETRNVLGRASVQWMVWPVCVSESSTAISGLQSQVCF